MHSIETEIEKIKIPRQIRVTWNKSDEFSQWKPKIKLWFRSFVFMTWRLFNESWVLTLSIGSIQIDQGNSFWKKLLCTSPCKCRHLKFNIYILFSTKKSLSFFVGQNPTFAYVFLSLILRWYVSWPIFPDSAQSHKKYLIEWKSLMIFFNTIDTLLKQS